MRTVTLTTVPPEVGPELGLIMTYSYISTDTSLEHSVPECSMHNVTFEELIDFTVGAVQATFMPDDATGAEMVGMPSSVNLIVV